MRKFSWFLKVALLFLFIAWTGIVCAETIELVTYYPASNNTGNLHGDTLTVGPDYANVVPGLGVALIENQLGIGTTAPVAGSRLEVVGVDGQPNSVLFLPGAGVGADIRVGIGTAAPSDRLQVTDGNIVCGSTGAGQLNIGIGQTNIQARSGANPSALNLNFFGGNVGIGAIAPQYPLDVNGNVQFRGDRLYFPNPVGSNNLFWIMAGGNTEGTNNALGFNAAFGAVGGQPAIWARWPFYFTGALQGAGGGGGFGTSDLVLNPNGGNVGIGTAAPAKRLSVQDSGTRDVNVASFFCPNITNQMDVLIGKQQSAGKCLSIGYSEALANGWIGMWGGPLIAKVIVFNGTSGNVGIATGNSPTSYRLDVAGQAHATGFPTSSDIRLKTHVAPLTGVLEKLDQIRPVRFDWNDTYKKLGRASGHREIGVVAQDVEAVFPELVTHWGEQEYEAVDYGRFTAVLLEAVKELKAQDKKAIQKLENENAALRKRVETLEAATVTSR